MKSKGTLSNIEKNRSEKSEVIQAYENLKIENIKWKFDSGYEENSGAVFSPSGQRAALTVSEASALEMLEVIGCKTTVKGWAKHW